MTKVSDNISMPDPFDDLGFTKHNQTLKVFNRGLLITIFILGVIILFLIKLLFNSHQLIEDANKTHSISIPPDISQGALVETGTPHKANVFGFTNYVMQSLNHWPSNGLVEYDNNIFNASTYITPNFQAWLKDDFAKLSNRYGINELLGRQRMLLPIDRGRFNAKSVKTLSDGVWHVTLSYQLKENYRKATIKDTGITYVLRVIQSNVDAATNKWGMKIDAQVEDPTRFDIRLEGTSHG